MNEMECVGNVCLGFHAYVTSLCLNHSIPQLEWKGPEKEKQ